MKLKQRSNGINLPVARAVLSTLALAQAENIPGLSRGEITRFLHKQTPGETSPSDEEVSRALDALARNGPVRKEKDLFSLSLKPDLEATRRNTERISQEKLRAVRAPLRMVSALPFVHAVAVTGSVAFGSARQESDIDILLVARKGRIWTARLLALIIMELFGMRREKRRSPHKLCLNYLVTEDAVIPTQNAASANLFARALPVCGAEPYARFLSQNAWLSNFLFLPVAAIKGKTNNEPGKPDFVERCARHLQLPRLQRKTPRGEDAKYFILSDTLLALHAPHPKNKTVMKKYLSLRGPTSQQIKQRKYK